MGYLYDKCLHKELGSIMRKVSFIQDRSVNMISQVRSDGILYDSHTFNGFGGKRSRSQLPHIYPILILYQRNSLREFL